MLARPFAITVFPLIIFVLTSLAVFADDPSAELDELPPIPTFKLPPEPKDEAKEQNEKVADEPDDEIEEFDGLPPVPTYTPQSKPKEEAKEQSEKSDEKPDDKRERLMKEAEAGSAEAAMELVKEAESKNITAAAERWLKVAAEAGSAEAWFKLGLIAIEKDDDQTAFERLKKSADAGYEDAKIYLAFGYMEGLGTKKDVEKGKALLLSVADAGNATAIRKLAHAYRLGIGFEKDEQKALELLTQLYQNAKDDSTRVMAAANLWVINDKDGLKRVDELLDKLDASALQTSEFNNAALLLSGSLLEHYFQNTDNDKAIAQRRFTRLMDILLDAGNWDVDEGTLFAVVKVCEDNAIVPDSEKARLFLAMDQLASRSNPAAMLSLAYLYVKGIGTEKNRYMFDYWLEKAANNGYAPAEFYAAIFLSDDDKSMSDRKAAFLKHACDEKFLNAFYFNLIGALTQNNDSPTFLEVKKLALAQTEELIEQYLINRKVNKSTQNNNSDLIISDIYLKWGRGCIVVDYAKIQSKEIKRPVGVDLFNPDNMTSDLWQYDYYINIGDLCYAAAYCYENGTAGDSFDRAKFRELLLLVKENGNNLAWLDIIDDYWMSDEDDKALEELKKAMDDNIPWAFLAQFKYTCYNPDGTENFDQAFEYLQKAAELNYSPAYRYLGMCYILGKGVKQDVEKGVKLLEDNKECVILMVLYGRGLGVDRDEEKSRRYFAMELAKDDKSNSRNQYTIAEKTNPVIPFNRFNYEEALIYAEHYLYFNKYCLKRMEREGVLHAGMHLGLEQTNREAQRTYLRNAANNGDPFDMSVAGYCLINSADQQLKREGMELFRKAAQSGQPMAMVALGSQSIKDGMNEDDPVKRIKLLEEGRQWLKQGADKGNMSLYLTFAATCDIVGFKINPEEYQRCLDLAIELNYTQAMIDKASLLLHNLPSIDSAEYRQAFELIQRAADMDSPLAIKVLQALKNSDTLSSEAFNSAFRGIPNKDSGSSGTNSAGWYYNEIQKKYFPSSPYDSYRKRGYDDYNELMRKYVPQKGN